MSKLKAQTDTAPAPRGPMPPMGAQSVARGVEVPALQAAASEVALPLCQPCTRFTLWAHPNRWHLTPSGNIVPMFRRQYRNPGQSAVGGGQYMTNAGPVITVDTSTSDAILIADGWRQIPDGFHFGSAVCKQYMVRGGVAWLAQWETPHIGSPLITVDETVLVAYVEAARAAGYIGNPSHETLTVMHSRLQNQADEARSRAERSHDRGHARRAEHFDRMVGYLDAILTPEVGDE